MTTKTRAKIAKIRKRVTQRDIDYGEYGVTKSCAFALSLKRSLRPGCSFYVLEDEICISKDRDEVLLPLPPRLAAFIADFDRGLPVSPTSFTVQIPKRFLARKTR